MPKTHYFLPILDNLTIRSRGNTPHWEMPNATYSITYRLHDSVAPAALGKLREERDWQERRATTAFEKLEIRRAFEHKLDQLLDRSEGACYLAQPRIAQLVIDAWQCFDSDRYELIAWCVMPNHVHVVMRTLREQSLARILHSWKSYSAKRANEVLGREGVLWQREYYDRIVRDEKDLADTVEYVLRNPERAGLREWPFAGWKPA